MVKRVPAPARDGPPPPAPPGLEAWHVVQPRSLNSFAPTLASPRTTSLDQSTALKASGSSVMPVLTAPFSCVPFNAGPVGNRGLSHTANRSVGPLAIAERRPPAWHSPVKRH